MKSDRATPSRTAATSDSDRPRREGRHVALAIGALHGVAGGGERVLVDVANGLHRRGWTVTVLTYQDRNGPSYYPLDYGIERLDGRRRHVRGSASARPAMMRSVARRHWSLAAIVWVMMFVPRILRLRRLLRISRPDVAVGFMPSTFPYLVLSAIGLRTKVVASIHNVPDRELGGDPNRWDQNPVDIAVRNRSLRIADAVTVLLPSFVEQLPQSVAARTYVVPNMVPVHRGRPAVVGTDDDDNVILAVGRLAHAKDHRTLIEAWARLEKRHPTWRVRILGDGPLRHELDDLVTTLGLRRVSIEEPTPAVYEAYTAARLLAMPSIHEGFGLVTAEALSCGLPVVGFADCEGTNEIVVDGVNGVLVDPGTDRVSAYATALDDLIGDELRRISLAQKAPVSVERFAPDEILDTWESMLDSVIDARTKRRG